MRRLILLSALSCLAACGRRSSGEFDDRPPVPMAGVAEPVAPDPDEDRAGPDTRPGEDLRGPRRGETPADDPSLPGRGPAMAPTYTYVPVPSPRVLPGEMVPSAPPASDPVPRSRTFEPGTRPAEIPVTVAPPPPAGAPATPPPPGGAPGDPTP